MSSWRGRAQQVADLQQKLAPYEAGDQIRVTDPAGTEYRARVEKILPDDSGYRVVAAVVAPRRLRNQMVVALVDLQGVGPHVAPW